MLYCTKCQRLTEGEKCPACNRSRALRQPRADDPVLLCTVRYVLAAMIEPLLRRKRYPTPSTRWAAAPCLAASAFWKTMPFTCPMRLTQALWSF